MGGGGVSPNIMCARRDDDKTLPNFIKRKHPRKGEKKKRGVIRTKVQASKHLELCLVTCCTKLDLVAFDLVVHQKYIEFLCGICCKLV